jgi:hypothetical protein
VVERNVSQGQPVAANSPALFLIAADPKQMEVDTTASQNDIGAIREGNKATMTVDAQSNRVFVGVVSQVRRSPQSVQNAVTYDAVVNIDNSDLARAGSSTALWSCRRQDAGRRPAGQWPVADLGAAWRRACRGQRHCRARRRQFHRDRPGRT